MIIALAFSPFIVSAQFNSVIRPDEPIQINLIRKPLIQQIQDTTKKASPKMDKTEDVEELKKEPKYVELNNTDKGEAIVFSNFGACLPINKIYLTSAYGSRIHPITKRPSFHTGIDLSARSANIHAVLHGSVLETGYNSIIGNFIKLTHGNYITVYGHLSEVYVSPGELVKVGEVIGLSGSTGRSTGEHLHFTVKYKGNLINPLIFLNTIMRANPNDLFIALKN